MGKHLLLEVYDVKFELLNDLSAIALSAEGGIKRSKMTILNKLTHQFTPQGVSVLFFLAESHVSIHTFPEHGCLTADAYTCGEGNPKIIIIELLKYFNSDNYKLREFYR